MSCLTVFGFKKRGASEGAIGNESLIRPAALFFVAREKGKSLNLEQAFSGLRVICVIALIPDAIILLGIASNP
ncbi:MAG: hypothetical protein R6X08_06235 [Desulfosalsimonadaceae bacterium]